MNISEQVKELRNLATEFNLDDKEELATMSNEAADTIEALSAKLAAVNGGGWIACEDRLPEDREDCLVTVRYTGFMGMYGFWIKTGHVEPDGQWWGDCIGGEVIAWQRLPEPYSNKTEEIDAYE